AGVGRQLGLHLGGFDGGIAALTGLGPGGGAHGGYDRLTGGRFHGDDRVARIDWALEGVAAFHGHDVGHLRHAQQGGHAGHQVLAEGSGRAEHVGVAVGQLGDLRGQHLGDRVGVPLVGDGQHAGHAVDLGGLGSDGGRVGGQHHDVDGFGGERLGGGDALGGGGVEGAVQVLGDDQDFGHVGFLGSVVIPAHAEIHGRPVGSRVRGNDDGG